MHFKATHSHILAHHVQELEISILWTNKYYLCVFIFFYSMVFVSAEVR